MTRPRLLDLFCGAGGAAMGYHRAGFDVVGVDIEPQPDYPFEFIQDDALAVLFYLLTKPPAGLRSEGFVAVHASPPCQAYSVTASLHTAEYPKLIAQTREWLQRAERAWSAQRIPYIIENVAGARSDMLNPITLCGSSFGLGVRRHRLFETSWPIGLTPPCAHHLQPEPIDVTGTGASRTGPRLDGKGGNSRKPRNLAHAREVMGVDWMSRVELSESVPPAYTQWIGEQLIAHLAERAA